MSAELPEFKPWNIPDSEVASRLNLDIYEPPCRRCQFWRPRIKTSETGYFDGVVLCVNIGNQCNDFSCYRPKEGA